MAWKTLAVSPQFLAQRPLNDSKTALYRLNVGYRSTQSFIDFNQARRFSIAPSLSFNLGKNTDLAIEGDVNRLERNGHSSSGLPAVGMYCRTPMAECVVVLTQ